MAKDRLIKDINQLAQQQSSYRYFGSNDKVTRLEVIDDTGRVVSYRPCKIELSYQDDGRTLKVFVTPTKEA